MKNNYIYAALGLLALFLISKNKRVEVIEERKGLDAEKETKDPIKDEKIDFKVKDEVILF
jgi:hypothetical protein